MLWSYDPNTTLKTYSPTADPVVADGVVYFMTNDNGLLGVLHAVDLETHQSRWEYTTPQENFSAPAVSEGVLIWGSLDNNLYAVSAADGALLWTFPTDNIIFSATAIAGDTAYFGSTDKNLYALDVQSGQQRWQFRAGSGVSSPAIADGIVYVGTQDGILYALQ